MDGLRIKVFADGANLDSITRLSGVVDGFTTNPSLMKAAGITDYREFGKHVVSLTSKPVSFEVLADDWENMERQAREIHSWGPNVYVKIPVMNCDGVPSYDMIAKLAGDRIKLNVTAVFTEDQAKQVNNALAGSKSIVSVFAGRIADTGVDPLEVMDAVRVTLRGPELLWASTREVINVYQAEWCGADIITLSPDLIAKIPLRGKDLTEYSRDTVRQFYKDAKGITL